jgi:transposase
MKKDNSKHDWLTPDPGERVRKRATGKRAGRVFDGRKVSHKALEEIRIRAVARVEAGESPEVVIRALGFTRPRIYEWLAKYREGGIESLRAKPVPGRPPKLKGWQLRWIRKTIVEKNPLQLRFEFALWTRSMVRALIRLRFGVRLSEVSVGRLLRRLGLSPQRPLRRAYQQDPIRVQRWLEQEYPKIKALAKKEGAAIYFGDEAGVRSDFHSGTTWAPVGRTPQVPATGARFGFNIVSAISARGRLRFMVFEDKLNGPRFVEFLKRLLHKSRRPIFLIVDGHPAHRAAFTKKFLRKADGRLRLFFLPPYSPELNPDEFVWNNLKNHAVGKRIITGPEQLRNTVVRHMVGLQHDRRKVRSFFLEELVRYAA